MLVALADMATSRLQRQAQASPATAPASAVHMDVGQGMDETEGFDVGQHGGAKRQRLQPELQPQQLKKRKRARQGGGGQPGPGQPGVSGGEAVSQAELLYGLGGLLVHARVGD